MNYNYQELAAATGNFTKRTVVPHVKMTPKLASDILANNTMNRPLSNREKGRYIEKMKAGLWTETGQDNICFSKLGKLMNGQHRLYSVVDSGTNQYFDISCGIEESTFTDMDIGKGRTASDAVAIAGYKENYSTMASAARIILSLNDGAYGNGGHRSNKKRGYTNGDIVKYLDTQCEDVHFLNECCKSGRKFHNMGKFFSVPTYTAFCYHFGQKNATKSHEFFYYLSTGEDLTKNKRSYILLLRRRLENDKAISTIERYALLIKVWNLFIKQKEISSLRWDPKEGFPVAIHK